MSMQPVASEWLRRVEAEYRSAAIAQHYTLWLIQVGASPDLIDYGMDVARDEIRHARLSHEVFIEAGGSGGPNLDRDSLQLQRTSALLEEDLLLTGVRFFCLGETVAVPLFQRMREACTVPKARAAIEEILVDEVRHRDFGWTLLHWLLAGSQGALLREILNRDLPSLIAEQVRSYSCDKQSEDISPHHRQWGLIADREYAEILQRCHVRDYLPRFAACDIDLPGPPPS